MLTVGLPGLFEIPQSKSVQAILPSQELSGHSISFAREEWQSHAARIAIDETLA